jgi:hypothetical protein
MMTQSSYDVLKTDFLYGKSNTVIDMHTTESVNNTLRKSKELAFLSEDVSRINSDAPSWLPFAAEQYNISSDMRDYIIVPVIILPSDIPNRNMVAFPFLELTKFNVAAGMLTYMTWKGKPTFLEHMNMDPTQARGVVFDVSIRQMSKSSMISKVVALCGFDRNKDSSLVDMIVDGRREYYSMGAMIESYSCSVCGGNSNSRRDLKELTCGTRHIDKKLGKFKSFELQEGNILGHYNAHGITGFEVSSVSWPAWPSAYTGIDQHMKV